MAEDYHVITGIIHVHTTDSDGTKSHEEIAAIARELGLDYLLFSDHMTLKGLHEGKEGFYDGVLVLIGYEHNDREDCNHYLIFDHDRVFPASMGAEEYVAAGARDKVLGIMAHPDEIRGRDARFRSYPWTAGDLDGVNGLEIWNQMSEWMENLSTFNQLRMVFSPRKALRGPTGRVLWKWDELSQKRKMVGIGSTDAHGFLYRAGPLRLTIFPYKVQFKTIRTHLILPEMLSQDLDTARKQVYDALLDCRAFVSNYRWGDAQGFRFEIHRSDQRATSGGEIGLTQDLETRVYCPHKGRIRIIADGRSVYEASTRELEYKLEKPGLYRVEVYRGRRGWIYSNHIRVRERPAV